MHCVGNNVKSATYEIEGESSYFDYGRRDSVDNDSIVEIYSGFPLSEEGKIPAN